jgi:peptidoglycan-associated lipoprotein
MLKKEHFLAVVALGAAALLGACSSSGDKDSALTTAPATSAPASGISTSASTSPYAGSGHSISNSAGSTADLSKRSVYFDFDSSELKPESAAVVANWGQYLLSSPTAKVRLEGNTDERGTREYNIALGERRANAVAQALEARGVSSAQITVTSYGEERPVALGHDEASWSQNRRVDIVQQ